MLSGSVMSGPLLFGGEPVDVGGSAPLMSQGVMMSPALLDAAGNVVPGVCSLMGGPVMFSPVMAGFVADSGKKKQVKSLRLVLSLGSDVHVSAVSSRPLDAVLSVACDLSARGVRRQMLSVAPVVLDSVLAADAIRSTQLKASAFVAGALSAKSSGSVGPWVFAIQSEMQVAATSARELSAGLGVSSEFSAASVRRSELSGVVGLLGDVHASAFRYMSLSGSVSLSGGLSASQLVKRPLRGDVSIEAALAANGVVRRPLKAALSIESELSLYRLRWVFGVESEVSAGAVRSQPVAAAVEVSADLKASSNEARPLVVKASVGGDLYAHAYVPGKGYRQQMAGLRVLTESVQLKADRGQVGLAVLSPSVTLLEVV
ncbi:hypothetical protein [Aliamphritea hakodatensis]|uniref:hypothetical protein n=1 Tax=Aliamphritea hakodatensis TaxID=2895352 RepID=UPI0022FD76DC|nr:hypothetical protein [Aliamphritea hakodatensis]